MRQMDKFKVPVVPSTASKVANDEDIIDETSLEIDQIQDQTLSASCPYKVPKWSAPPENGRYYKLEVLKSGQIIEEIKELHIKATWSFGRLPDNNIEMAHPTISRYHAVLQYKPKATKQIESSSKEETEDDKGKCDQPAGWYIYDLNSTHGTFLNKQRVPPRVYIRIHVGHMLKLGASTRVYILQGPKDDEEPESELTVTELRAQHKQQVADAAVEAKLKALETENRERNEGINWGMSDDADEETDITHNPYASTNNEELFMDDPKRTLRGYFEREGLQLDYKCDEMSAGSFVCRIELPLDDANGRPIIAEVVHKGRKKDCVVQCALEACRILDRLGVLRQANQEPHRRKQQSKSDESDDDDFLDRTGDIERKKKHKANIGVSVPLTYDDLIKQQTELNEQLRIVESNITAYHYKQQQIKSLKELQQTDAGDDLDSFMDVLKTADTELDKTEIKKLRLEQQRLKSEQLRVNRLIEMVKPTELKFEQLCNAQKSKKTMTTDKKQLPMIGRRNQFSKFKVNSNASISKVAVKKVESRVFASDEEELDDDEDSDDNNLATNKTKSADNKFTEELQQSQVTENKPSEIEDCKKVNDTSDYTVKDKADNNVSQNQINELSSRKRRARLRQRNKLRADIDVDELAEYESSEKYSKWVPPANQTGDGITKLNEKFGY